MSEIKWPEWQPIETARTDGRPIIARDAKFRVRAIWYWAPSSTTKGWRTWENTGWFKPTHWLCHMPDDRRLRKPDTSIDDAIAEAKVMI